MKNTSVKGKDGIVVDPDPNSLYTKRKLAKQSDTAGQSYVLPTSSSSSAVALISSEQTVNFQIMAGQSLGKNAAFTKAEMNRFIEKVANT